MRLGKMEKFEMLVLLKRNLVKANESKKRFYRRIRDVRIALKTSMILFIIQARVLNLLEWFQRSFDDQKELQLPKMTQCI